MIMFLPITYPVMRWRTIIARGAWSKFISLMKFINLIHVKFLRKLRFLYRIL